MPTNKTRKIRLVRRLDFSAYRGRDLIGIITKYPSGWFVSSFDPVGNCYGHGTYPTKAAAIKELESK